MCGKRTDDHSRGTRGKCGTNGGQAEAARLSANDRQTDNSSSPVRFSKLARQALQQRRRRLAKLAAKLVVAFVVLFFLQPKLSAYAV